MNTFLKYILYFILGIIVYYLLFHNNKLIEGYCPDKLFNDEGKCSDILNSDENIRKFSELMSGGPTLVEGEDEIWRTESTNMTVGELFCFGIHDSTPKTREVYSSLWTSTKSLENLYIDCCQCDPSPLEEDPSPLEEDPSPLEDPSPAAVPSTDLLSETQTQKYSYNLAYLATGAKDSRGCQNYHCKNSASTYDNWIIKIPSDSIDSDYYTCSNVDTDKHIHGNEGIKKCNNEICCDNYVCREHVEESECENNGKQLLPNKKCRVQELNVDIDCDTQSCCGVISDTSFNTSMENLFNDIIEFRNNHGGNTENGEKITGEDIRNYLYHELLHLEDMSKVGPINISTLSDGSLKGIIKPDEIYAKMERCADIGSSIITYINEDKYFPQIIGDVLIKEIEVNQYGNCPPGVDEDTCPQVPEGVNVNGTCEDWASWDNGLDMQINYLILNNKDNLKYGDYKILSNWLSNIDNNNDDEINSKVILIEDLENLEEYNPTTTSVNIDYIITNIKSTKDISKITKLEIKKFIVNLDKNLSTNNNIKPLDRFFHTYLNENKNIMIDKNMFLSLINQSN